MIDVNFNFTSDTPKYWDNYWGKDPLFGGPTYDPDNASSTMRLYQKLLYSKPLPNGETMDLKIGSGSKYLTWKDFRFGSDSILASVRYVNYRDMIERVAERLPNYQEFMENFLHKAYTIGGEIIFPKRTWGINPSRGCNYQIKDRWDLTLECIRRYYLGEDSPLYSCLIKDKAFFDLFVDFKGYVDFFYLQDCVTEDYSRVKFWIGNGEFEHFPLPKTVDEYLTWIENELDFVAKRNARIAKAINS